MSARLALPPARAPRSASELRLLRVDPRAGTLGDFAFDELPELLVAGDLLVVNDAATLPASLRLSNGAGELRLVAREGESRFRAVVFGAGDFRLPTEARSPAPELAAGTRLALGTLSATVVAVDTEEPRLVTLEFEQAGAALLAGLYREGRLIQYSYLARPLELWDAQSRFAGRPWAFEPPSAGLPLTFALFDRIRARGVEIAWLSHAAGLSSTGSERLDRRLPFPERYELPERTVAAVADTRARGGRVLAVGTTVVRALESSAKEHGAPRAGLGEARLIIGPGFAPRVVSGLLTGMHEPTTSHYGLLQAFAPRALLDRALEVARAVGYLQHEFGDSCLIL
jgi:S-adenosylmethionine:tRNA ribosyltransferase-isomerase